MNHLVMLGDTPEVFAFRGKSDINVFTGFRATGLVKMPKRLNPFGDAAPLQYKSHIGMKEVDLGVNSSQNMKAVYGKTT